MSKPQLVMFPVDVLKPSTDQRVGKARDDAERQAWLSLARYKFWMFGYHAAQWVLLNRVSADRKPNPFKALVLVARKAQR